MSEFGKIICVVIILCVGYLTVLRIRENKDVEINDKKEIIIPNTFTSRVVSFMFIASNKNKNGCAIDFSDDNKDTLFSVYLPATDGQHVSALLISRDENGEKTTLNFYVLSRCKEIDIDLNSFITESLGR